MKVKMELEKLINRLLEIQKKVGPTAEVSLCVESTHKGEQFQLEESLKDLAVSENRVILLGESFD